MPQLNIRIDAELAALFHEMCAKHETTASEVMRKAIATFVERDMAIQREHEGNVTVSTVGTVTSTSDRVGNVVSVVAPFSVRSPPPRFPKAPYGSRAKATKKP